MLARKFTNWKIAVMTKTPARKEVTALSTWVESCRGLSRPRRTSPSPPVSPPWFETRMATSCSPGPASLGGTRKVARSRPGRSVSGSIETTPLLPIRSPSHQNSCARGRAQWRRKRGSRESAAVDRRTRVRYQRRPRMGAPSAAQMRERPEAWGVEVSGRPGRHSGEGLDHDSSAISGPCAGSRESTRTSAVTDWAQASRAAAAKVLPNAALRKPPGNSGTGTSGPPDRRPCPRAG
jgi:hypothetical protein